MTGPLLYAQPDLFAGIGKRRRPGPPPVQDVDGRFISGKLLADRGRALALQHSGDWGERVVLEAGAWCAERKRDGMTQTTIEAFRQVAVNKPESHKAWGALPKLLCRAGLLAEAKTLDGHPLYTKAGSLKTHAHPVKVWTLL